MKKAIIIALILVFTVPCFAADEKKGPTEEQIFASMQLTQQRMDLAVLQYKAAQDDMVRLKALLKAIYRAQKEAAKK